jgi:hypothetical protein
VYANGGKYWKMKKATKRWPSSLTNQILPKSKPVIAFNDFATWIIAYPSGMWKWCFM